jgi:hypothetical protein
MLVTTYGSGAVTKKTFFKLTAFFDMEEIAHSEFVSGSKMVNSAFDEEAL